MLGSLADNPVFCLCRWFPVVFVTALTVWSYYAYVVVLCATLIDSDSIAQKVFYLIFFHIIDVLFISTYWSTILSKPKTPPTEFYLTEEEEQELVQGADLQSLLQKIIFSRKLPVKMRALNDEIRFCDKSRCIKPDRSHYCSISRKCVLKMDHFCPWVNVTVGFSNYKCFVLFLMYTELYTMYIALTALPTFIDVWSTKKSDISSADRMNMIFLFFIAMIFSLGVWSLLGFHLFLLFTNRTTLESSRAPLMFYGKDKKAFGLGWRENFRQVMGPVRWKWFLPFKNSIGDGVSFPLRRQCNENEHLLKSLKRMEEGSGSDQELSDTHVDVP
ncbi:palmitoyltransferase ZDHHC20-like [Oscarella lobularis]|uniref:palmitoyltransferase ZDHHC20-like n=1 Tax=Oscarella lobularis TaxID=121494 RepID=UPI003313D3AE